MQIIMEYMSIDLYNKELVEYGTDLFKNINSSKLNPIVMIGLYGFIKFSTINKNRTKVLIVYNVFNISL